MLETYPIITSEKPTFINCGYCQGLQVYHISITIDWVHTRALKLVFILSTREGLMDLNYRVMRLVDETL